MTQSTSAAVTAPLLPTSPNDVRRGCVPGDRSGSGRMPRGPVGWLRARPAGALTEVEVVVPADALAAVPDAVGGAEASTLPMNGLTVVSALAHLALPAGAALGVTGAAGAVGGYAIELGREAGLRVVADAQPKDRAL